MLRDINNEDVRIQATGFVKEIVDKEHVILDDKTGQIEVNLKDVDFNFKENDLINVFGEIEISMAGEKSFTAEIIQDKNENEIIIYSQFFLKNT